LHGALLQRATVKISYARQAEKNYKIAAAKKLVARSRTQLINLKSSALYHLSGELVLFQGTNETLFNMGKAGNRHPN